MSIEFCSWVSDELGKKLGAIDFVKGVDLNQNGNIEENEKVDLDNNGEISVDEIETFLNQNKQDLQAMGGYFKIHQFDEGLSPDNPINELLKLELDSGEITEYQIQLVYHRIKTIVKYVKDEVAKHPELSPQEMLTLVYQKLSKDGFVVESGSYSIYFSDYITDMKIDCDVSSYIALAVASEMGWPVVPVTVPFHEFVRWDDGNKVKFNMDFGIIAPDSYYIFTYNLSEQSISLGIYLKSLDANETKGEFYALAGHSKLLSKNYEEAVTYLNKAVELNPVGVPAYLELASTYSILENYDLAYENAIKTLSMDQGSQYAVAANYIIGLAYFNWGSFALSKIFFDKAIALAENLITTDYPLASVIIGELARAYSYRGYLSLLSNDYQNAENDISDALSLDPDATMANWSYGLIKLLSMQFNDAELYLKQAIKSDPTSYQAYALSGCMNMMSGDPIEAMKFFGVAYQLDPSGYIAFIGLFEMLQWQKALGYLYLLDE